jgi:glycosyltransferase involved in cell wall biosynthesis
VKIGLVIATRNRPAFAAANIRSILSQDEDFVLVVSDNSERLEDREELERICRDARDPRLIYIRTPASLTMPTHWNWAMEQALARTDATHLGIQYDRRLWKPGAIRLLAAAIAAAPEMTMIYGWDSVFASPQHSVATRLRASGALYAIRTSEIIERCARAEIVELDQAYPALANCIVPRATFDRVRAKFGNICDSDTPDASFLFRLCAVDDVLHHYDRALIITYGYAVSNGWAYLRGDQSGSWADWITLWGDRSWIDAAPIPGLSLGYNVMFHEYNLVRRIAGDRFPPIDHERYLSHLGSSLAYISDPEVRAKMRAILKTHGWREPAPEPQLARPLYKRILGPPTRPLRRLVSAVRSKVQRHFGSADTAIFANDDDGVRYLLDHEYTPDSRSRERFSHAVPVAFNP